MEEAKKVRFKIFLWDQLVRPFYLLLNLYQLQALFIALLILNVAVWKNDLMFWILTVSLAIIFLYQLVQYYNSGEFMYNYRKYKSEKGEYKDYKKAAKILKKEKAKKEAAIEIQQAKGGLLENTMKKEENKNEQTKEKQE